jgi:hypothetical protein
MVILIFGASGSVGGGVLQACLASPVVTEVRAIARRPLAVAHSRLRFVQHQTYDDYSAAAGAFAGVDACLYCLGKSSTQVSGERLFRLARPLMRLLKPFRRLYVRADDIGRAMLAATAEGMRGRILENAEIRTLADAARSVG